jgi:hypothetical protein
MGVKGSKGETSWSPLIARAYGGPVSRCNGSRPPSALAVTCSTNGPGWEDPRGRSRLRISPSDVTLAAPLAFSGRSVVRCSSTAHLSCWPSAPWTGLLSPPPARFGCGPGGEGASGPLVAMTAHRGSAAALRCNAGCVAGVPCRSVVGVWSPEHLGWDAIGPGTRLEERTRPGPTTTGQGCSGVVACSEADPVWDGADDDQEVSRIAANAWLHRETMLL